jgi:hypothetical protein
MVMPAGLEQVFAVVGLPIDPGEFLPPSAITEELADKLKELNGKLDQTIYSPDYLD